MAGYSGTPLAKKLGIKPGFRILLENAPADYDDLVAPLPERASFVARVSHATDMVHIFSTKRAHLERTIRSALARMRHDCVIWTSWPKKSSKASTDITEDAIREIALPLGLVDVKVCAVDATWSGLKLVIRKELR